MEGWMDEKDGQMDGWADGQINNGWRRKWEEKEKRKWVGRCRHG